MLQRFKNTTKEKPPKQSSKALLKKWIFPIVGFITFSAALFALIYIDSRFYLKKIYVVTPEKQTTSIQQLQGLYGTHLLWEKEETIGESIRKVNPTLKKVTVVKQLPDTILISYEKYAPQVLLSTGNDQYILSGEGVVLGRNIAEERKDISLPLVTYYRTIPAGHYRVGAVVSEKDIKDSLYFHKLLNNMGLKVNSIDIAGFHMLGLYTEDKEFLFSSEKDTELQKYQLETVIRQFRREGEEYSKIDVRFDKPVVTF